MKTKSSPNVPFMIYYWLKSHVRLWPRQLYENRLFIIRYFRRFPSVYCFDGQFIWFLIESKNSADVSFFLSSRISLFKSWRQRELIKFFLTAKGHSKRFVNKFYLFFTRQLVFRIMSASWWAWLFVLSIGISIYGGPNNWNTFISNYAHCFKFDSNYRISSEFDMKNNSIACSICFSIVFGFVHS